MVCALARSLLALDGQKIKQVSCTRWKEVQEMVAFHAHLAGHLEAPTEFGLLNHPGGSFESSKVVVS